MSEINTEPETMPASQSWEAEDSDVQEIDLVEVGYLLLEKIHELILCFLAGAVLFNAFAYFLIEPTYQSTSKLYVVSSSSDSVVNLSDLNLGTSLTSDYEELILSYPMLDIVIDELDLDMTSDDLAEMITLTNPSDTRILRITATSTDPQEAMDIANKVAEVAAEYLPATMSTLEPNIAQEAKLADHKAGPSYTRYTLMGALIGLILCAGVIIVLYLLDDSVHSGQEMEKIFGLVPLTEIPSSDQLKEADSDHSHRESSHNHTTKRGIRSIVRRIGGRRHA